jgi:pimeloyl-ACP methyl ester carboxylesterase
MECEIDGIKVYYEICGEGKPVVMLHGWGFGRLEMTLSMEPQFAERDGWKRVYLDLPGRGKTPGADWIVSSDQELDLLEKFIDQIIPGERFLVVGQSYGGYLARGLVYRRGADIDGVLLTVFADRPARPEDLPPRTVVFRDPVLEAQARAQNLVGFLTVMVTQNASALERSRKLSAIPRPDQEFLDRLGKSNRLSFDVDALPQPCGAPALFVLGRQDHMCGYREAWKILEQYPRATFAVLDGGGHGLIGEKPDVFRALVQDWLDRVEQWSQTRLSADQATSPAPS